MTEDGVLQFEPRLAVLSWISPSHYSSFLECALREVFTRSRAPALLPLAPAARLGTALHRLLFEAATAEQEVDSGWAARRASELVSAQEASMRGDWLERHLVPLSRSVPQFEVRMLQGVHRAVELGRHARRGQSPTARTETGYGHELPVQTADGTIRGVIDAALPSVDGPVLLEFKTGGLYERGTETLRDAYRTQLLLYAAAYHARFDEWPVRADILSATGARLSIDVSPSEASAITDEAREVLASLNRRIAAGEDPSSLASPSPEACSACRYRPGCSAYRAARSGTGWPHDIWGDLVTLEPVRDGTAVASVATTAGLARVRSLTIGERRHPALARVRRETLSFFNLAAVGELAFAQAALTTIYVEGSGTDPA